MLLDSIVAHTNFTCIQTYGVLYNLNYTFVAAQRRGLKVIEVIWLQPDNAELNAESVRIGIEMAHQYKDTIIGVSCGSELRVRNAKEIATPLIVDCIQKVKQAKVPQPVTTNDYYWFWCEQAQPCQPWTEVMNLVDYIAVNVVAWWDNKHSPACAPAEVAAEVNLKMYRNAVRAYPNKLVVISEMGWPAGPTEGWEPYGYSELNDFSNQRCTGYANETNQNRVIFETLSMMKQYKVPGVTFSAFRETWKDAKEGDVGAFWGICDNTYPYNCKQGIFPVQNYPVRRPALPNVGDWTPIFPLFPGDTETAPPKPTPVIFPELTAQSIPVPIPPVQQSKSSPFVPKKSTQQPIPENSKIEEPRTSAAAPISIICSALLLVLLVVQ